METISLNRLQKYRYDSSLFATQTEKYCVGNMTSDVCKTFNYRLFCTVVDCITRFIFLSDSQIKMFQIQGTSEITKNHCF